MSKSLTENNNKYFSPNLMFEQMLKAKTKKFPVVLGALGAAPPKLGEKLKHFPGATSGQNPQIQAWKKKKKIQERHTPITHMGLSQHDRSAM